MMSGEQTHQFVNVFLVTSEILSKFPDVFVFLLENVRSENKNKMLLNTQMHTHGKESLALIHV